MTAAAQPQSQPQPLVEMRAIEKRFGNIIALSGVSFSIHAGECHCLLGDNGAGNSTFIKTMSGVHKPSGGTILVNGAEVMLESPRPAINAVKVVLKMPRQAINAVIATVLWTLALIPLMSMARFFFMGREPPKGWGP